MKLIGKANIPTWWRGLQATCWSCSSIFELESTDEPRLNVDAQGEFASLRCPNCPDRHIIFRKIYENHLPTQT